MKTNFNLDLNIPSSTYTILYLLPASHRSSNIWLGHPSALAHNGIWD